MIIIKGSLFDLLYNNGMLSVLIRIDEAILMSIHNIQFHDKKISLNFCFLVLSEEFRRESKTSSKHSR